MSDMHAGSLRYAESAKRIFDEAFAMTDVEAAVALIGSLVGTAIQEVSVVTRYNPKTGKPEKLGWEPNKVWDGQLRYDIAHGLLEEKHPLRKAITKRIPVGKALIVGNIAVYHAPGISYEQGITPNRFYFLKSV